MIVSSKVGQTNNVRCHKTHYKSYEKHLIPITSPYL